MICVRNAVVLTNAMEIIYGDENGDFTVNWPDGGFFPEESKIILG